MAASTTGTRAIQLNLFFVVVLVFGDEGIIEDEGGGSKGLFGWGDGFKVAV